MLLERKIQEDNYHLTHQGTEQEVRIGELQSKELYKDDALDELVNDVVRLHRLDKERARLTESRKSLSARIEELRNQLEEVEAKEVKLDKDIPIGISQLVMKKRLGITYDVKQRSLSALEKQPGRE